LLAVFAAAQLSDVLISYWYNTTTVKMCAIDNPSKCVYVLKLNFTADPKKTFVLWAYQDVLSIGNMYSNDYDMLKYVTVSSTLNAKIYIPAGYIYSSGQFSVNGMTSDKYTVCNMTLNYAFLIRQSGNYTVQNAPLPLYWLDPNTCTSYKYVVTISSLTNLTKSVYLYVFYMPTARAKGSWWLNGTQHIYYFSFYGSGTTSCTGTFCYSGNQMFLFPVAVGFYVAPNGTRYFTTIFNRGSSAGWWYGPKHFSALKNATLESSSGGASYLGAAYANIAYTMPPAPGDGIVYMYVPSIDLANGGDLAVIADNFTAYFLLNGPYKTSVSKNYMMIYSKRYSVNEVAISNGVDVYDARAIACPAYKTAVPNDKSWLVTPIPLSRAKEIEVCNNHTITLYVGIYQSQASPAAYSYVDEIKPGTCRRLRWDGAYSNTQTQMRIFNSTYNFCMGRTWMTISGDKYQSGWRYYITPSGLVAAYPIDPDAFYAAAWQALMQMLRQQYNATISALQQWLRQQANASKNIQNFIASQPQFIGTIKMDAATSTWLRTTLNELQKWRVTGSSASFGAVALPAVPTAVAPAAAAAVAVAWAASRRDDDVATTAAIAGIALTLFGILMTLIYGTSSLTLVALGVIVAAAAAAWRRIS
jgi:VIT1/CCC1 family predicted Fe2+/Mn2+ transporter